MKKDYVSAQKQINEYLIDYPDSEYIDEVKALLPKVNTEAEKIKVAEAEAKALAEKEKADKAAAKEQEKAEKEASEAAEKVAEEKAKADKAAAEEKEKSEKKASEVAEKASEEASKANRTTTSPASTIPTTRATITTKEPFVVTVDKLVYDLNENALKAANTYKGKYVELTGRVSIIDSSGSYFSLGLISNEYTFDTVLCDIEKKHKSTVSNFIKGQKVTVVGTITNVGEILGYTVDVDSIK